MQTYSIYSEESYVNRMELRKMYLPSVADLIYEKICMYRKLFRYELRFCKRKYYLTLNQTLYKKMLRIHNISLNRNILKKTHIDQIAIDTQFLDFLYSEEDILIKIYVLFYFIHDRNVCFYYIQLFHKEDWLAFLMTYTFSDNEYQEELDLTYGFRFFLDDLYQYICTSNNILKPDQLKMEQVNTLYPMLSEKEIKFYCNHDTLTQFYTISHYQKFYNQSYEASRLSMEKLCTYGFYEKIKVGKKFRYLPLLKIMK